MSTERRTWAAIKQGRTASSDVHAGYDRARRAYDLGHEVQELRHERGITQAALAKRAGTTQTAIARIEAGGVMPTIDSLDRIGAALGVTLTVRFDEIGTPPR
jgi:HTH-type transcriptional regulator/antitoxin HipB